MQSFRQHTLRNVAILLVLNLSFALAQQIALAVPTSYVRGASALTGSWATTTSWSPTGVPGSDPGDSVNFQRSTATGSSNYVLNLAGDRLVDTFFVSVGASSTATLAFNNLNTSREVTVTNTFQVGGRGSFNPSQFAHGTFSLGHASDTGTQTLNITGTTLMQPTNVLRAALAIAASDNGVGIFNLNNRGNLLVGTSSAPVDMFVGVMSRIDSTGPTGGEGIVTGTLNLNGGNFEAHVQDLSVGRRVESTSGDANLGNGIGLIDGGDFAGTNLDMTVYGTAYFGRGRTLGNTSPTVYTSSGTLKLGNPSNTANQTVRLLGSVEIGTFRQSEGLIELDANGKLEIGTSTTRSNVDIGVQMTDHASTSLGTLDVNGGTFTAWIDNLQVGYRSVSAGAANRVGRGRVDLTGVVLGSDGNVFDVNVARIGGGNGANSTGVMDAEVTLGAGTARIGDLYLGRDAGNVGDNAALMLQGTLLEIDGSASIGASGLVSVTVGGTSAGFDLTNNSPTALTMTAGSLGYEILFAQDISKPVALSSGFLLYGLKWEGNHVSELEAMFDDGRLTWDDTTALNGFLEGKISIFYDSFTNATYVGFAAPIPEPSTAGLLAFGLWGMIRRNRRQRG